MGYTVMEFIEKRNQLLLLMDVDGMIKFSNEANIRLPDTRQATIAGMHKARIAVVSTPEDKKEESRKWLTENGFTHSI